MDSLVIINITIGTRFNFLSKLENFCYNFAFDNNQVVNSQFKHKTDMTTRNLGVVIQSLSPSASKVVVALAEAKTDLKNIIMILLTTTVTIIIIIIINCGLHLTLAIIAPTLQVVSE